MTIRNVFLRQIAFLCLAGRPCFAVFPKGPKGKNTHRNGPSEVNLGESQRAHTQLRPCHAVSMDNTEGNIFLNIIPL